MGKTPSGTVNSLVICMFLHVVLMMLFPIEWDILDAH